MPCWISDFSYFDRVDLAIWAPIAIMGAIVGVDVLYASCCDVPPPRRLHRRGGAMQETPGCLVRGMWAAAPIALFCLDLMYPAITRTLLQFGTCRDLGEEAGKWLEADCT